MKRSSTEVRLNTIILRTFPRDFINTRIQAAGIGGDLETVMAWLCDGSEEGWRRASLARRCGVSLDA